EQELSATLTRFAVVETIRMVEASQPLSWPKGTDQSSQVDRLSQELIGKYGVWLAKNPALEDATALANDVAQSLNDHEAVKDLVSALELHESVASRLASIVSESLGASRKTFFDELLHAIEHERARLWTEQVEQVNWELHDRGSVAFNAFAME